MSERLTDAAIREAQARAEKATPGPWKAVNGRGSACVKTVDSRGRAIYINVRAGDSADVSDETVESWHADARFIAAVREDFPRIAAEALARGEEVARLRAAAIPEDAEDKIMGSLSDTFGHDLTNHHDRRVIERATASILAAIRRQA